MKSNNTLNAVFVSFLSHVQPSKNIRENTIHNCIPMYGCPLFTNLTDTPINNITIAIKRKYFISDNNHINILSPI